MKWLRYKMPSAAANPKKVIIHEDKAAPTCFSFFLFRSVFRFFLKKKSSNTPSRHLFWTQKLKESNRQTTG